MPGKDNNRFHEFVSNTQEFKGRVFQALEDITKDIESLFLFKNSMNGIKVQIKIQWWFIAAILLILISTIIKMWVME